MLAVFCATTGYGNVIKVLRSLTTKYNATLLITVSSKNKMEHLSMLGPNAKP